MLMMLETQHGFGTHQWDIPLSTLTPADIDVRELPGSIIRPKSSDMFPLLDTSFPNYRRLPDNTIGEIIYSVALSPRFRCRQEF